MVYNKDIIFVSITFLASFYLNVSWYLFELAIRQTQRLKKTNNNVPARKTSVDIVRTRLFNTKLQSTITKDTERCEEGIVVGIKPKKIWV